MSKPTTLKSIEDKVRHIEAQETSWQRAAWGFVMLGAFVGFWGAFQISGEALLWSDKLDKLGGFLSGAVATSFSLAGLMFVYLAFLGQKKELLYQREELRLTRQEMKRQVDVTQELADENAAQKQQMELQNAQLRKQAFENTFFEMLKTKTVLIGELQFREHKGINIFRGLCVSLEELYTEKSSLSISDRFTKQFGKSIIHYFRFVYTILKMIDESKFTDADKEWYAQIFRVQCTSAELIVLFYFSDSGSGNKIKNRVQKFAIFKGINGSDLLDPSHKNFYAPSAYGEVAESENLATEAQDAH